MGAVQQTMSGFTIDRRGAASLIAEELRRRIIEGDLAPGAPLRESELATAFDVARNTVRESLRLLTQEGIAVHEPHKGVSVRRLTPSEVRDIYALRGLLERGALARAGQLTEEEVERLTSILGRADAAVQQNDAKAVQQLNAEFHRQLVALLGNQRLDQLFDQLLGEIRLILTGFIGSPQPWPQRNRQLLQLLVDGDKRKFERELERYLQDSCDDAVARCESDPGQAP
ncbi:MAG: transcriptional regulator, GntR family [Frankiales bacterium]|jgi:DNA-binding GntR family transcriptional regulator|nr:transcriptional regulator, GntR family [Frankiales bacterium]